MVHSCFPPRLLIVPGLGLLLVVAPIATAIGLAATAGQPPEILGIDVQAGNLTGSDPLTINVSNVFSADDVHVMVGSKSAEVTDVRPGQSVTILIPGVEEPTGSAVDITVSTGSGSDTLASAYTYTPVLYASVIGSAAAGGGLVVDWLTQPDIPDQLVVVWVGNPANPDVSQQLSGYAGLIHEEPGLNFVTVTEDDHPFLLHFSPLPSILAGFPLHLQGLAKMEGAHKGSFTNVVTFVVP